MAEERANHLNEEIKALEQILREKKRALAEKGEAVSNGVEGEKELLKEAVKEHVERVMGKAPLLRQGLAGQAPSDQLSPPMPSDQTLQDDPLAGLDHRDQIEELAAVAFSKGIVEAVTIARRANDPHILDEFHDALVDRLYEYLVQEGIIERSQ